MEELRKAWGVLDLSLFVEALLTNGKLVHYNSEGR